MAKLVKADKAGIISASKHIQNDGVVIFPTETVFGIGASAYSEEGIKNIYRIKNRPSNNPLIMHVTNMQMAITFWSLNEDEKMIIDKLAILWPGPLTILAKRNKTIPTISQSEFVAIRCPDNKIAQELIYKSGCPIVAPSANISGKTSSTSLEHVKHYFNDEEEVIIIESEDNCDYGVESTIIKVDSNVVTIVRPGSILKEDIAEILKDIEILTKVEYSQSDSPGSDISHYQIRADTKLFNFINESTISTQSIFHEYTKGYLAESLLIDYGGINSCLSNYFKGYVDLSENSDPKEALYNLYNVLHQINDIREIRNVLVFDFYSNKAGYYQVLYDRLYRCCSGKKILIPLPDVESIGSFE